MKSAIFILLRVAIITAILLLLSSQATGTPLQEEIREEALKNGIDPDLAVAIAIVESGLRPDAVGQAGERSVFQLHPRYHAIVADESENIDTAIAYLKKLKKRCVARYGDAWYVCYNYGPNNRLNEPAKTTYFKKVQRTYKEIKGIEYVQSN